MKLELQELMRSIGQVLILVLNPVLKFLNTILGGITAVAKGISHIITSLFGGKTEAEEATENLTEDMNLASIGALEMGNAYSNAMGNAVDGTNALGDSISDATGNAKALRKQLAGFDDLNILNFDQNGNGISTGLGIPTYGNISAGLNIPDLSTTVSPTIAFEPNVKIDTSEINSATSIINQYGNKLLNTASNFYDKAQESSGLMKKASEFAGDFYSVVGEIASGFDE